jgi:uncharacterized membrane protein YhaH (DUF805 family)
MGIADILACLKKAADFRGRARRREFWSFLVFWIGAAVASAMALEIPPGPLTPSELMIAKTTPVLLIPLALLLPLAAVAVRRLHDIGLSGWWLVSAAAPVPVLDLFIVGAQVVCFAKAGTSGPNRYGPDPLQTDRNAPLGV